MLGTAPFGATSAFPADALPRSSAPQDSSRSGSQRAPSATCFIGVNPMSRTLLPARPSIDKNLASSSQRRISAIGLALLCGLLIAGPAIAATDTQTGTSGATGANGA